MSGMIEADCIFCRVVGGELPSDRLFEDDDLIVISDIAPAAPFHALVIPRRHVAMADDLEADDAALAGKMLLTATQVAREHELVGPGYRMVMNVNEGAGQTVFHIHLHILGGRPMGVMG